MNPRLAEAYFNRGVAYHALGQYQRAIQDYDQALRLNSAFADAYLNRGKAYEALGQPQRAWEDFRQAQQLSTE